MSRAKDWLRLARVPLAPTAAGDVVACALLARGPGLARGAPPLGLADALALAGTAVLVYAAGMAGNDLADRSRDVALHPERPLPAGRLSARAALAFVLACAAGAIAWGGGASGERWAVVAALLAAAAYDGGAKRRPTSGALAMAAVRAANASVGVVPLVLAGVASPWALAAPLAVGAYSAAVTLWSTQEEAADAPARGRRLASRLLLGVAFGGAGALAAVGAGGLAFGSVFVVPVLASLVFGRVPRRGPVPAQVREMLLGLYWLEAVLVTGGFAPTSWAAALGAFAIAFAAIVVTQLAMRALRR